MLNCVSKWEGGPCSQCGGVLGGLEEDVMWPDFIWYSELQCGLG